MPNNEMKRRELQKIFSINRPLPDYSDPEQKASLPGYCSSAFGFLWSFATFAVKRLTAKKAKFAKQNTDG